MIGVILIGPAFVGLSACSSDMDTSLVESNQIKFPDCEEIISLQDYNYELAKTNSSRDIGSVGWISVAVADGKGAYDGAKIGGRIGSLLGPKGTALGAFLGGAIVGGGASYTQYQIADKISKFSPYSVGSLTFTKQETITASYCLSRDSIKSIDYSLGLADGLDSCSVKIGIQHNKILEKVRDVELDYDLSHITQNLGDIEKQIIYNEEFKTSYNKIVSNPLENTFNPNYKADRIMQLFIDAVSNSCKSQADLNQIVAHYASVVKGSKALTAEDKDCLYAGFAVMDYSFQYWSEKWQSN